MVAGSLPLTPIQKWFLEQRLEDSQHYNQAFLFGVSERMERALLESALAEVSRQHDALRLRFVQSGETWRQSYSDTDERAPLTWTDLSSVGEAERRAPLEVAAAKAEANLNLQNGPLWRAVYFDLGKNQPGKLLIAVHHLAIDGISWRPLLEDLESAYRQLKMGRKVELPAKTTSYKAWAERLTQYSASETLRGELPYWKAVTEPRQAADALKPLLHLAAREGVERAEWLVEQQHFASGEKRTQQGGTLAHPARQRRWPMTFEPRQPEARQLRRRPPSRFAAAGRWVARNARPRKNPQ